MKTNPSTRLAALSLLATAGGLTSALGCNNPEGQGPLGCPEFSKDADYGAHLDVDAKLRTFLQASGRLQDLGNQVASDAGAACVDIAKAAGRNPSAWEGKQGSDLVTAACDEADVGLKNTLAAATGASLQVLVEGGECKVAVDAAADCYAKCDTSGKCSPGDLQVQCEPGKLAGRCGGTCEGTCEGGTVQCNGECSATCSGTCAGNCIGTCGGAQSNGPCGAKCEGQCTGGACSGTCSGACKVQGATCDGTCTGNCSVQFQEPRCTGNVTPPKCDLDAQCKSGCQARVQTDAQCTPPKLTVKVIGTSNARLDALVPVLEARLPVLVQIGFQRGKELTDAAGALASSAKGVASGAGSLSVKAGACAVAAAQAALAASVQIQVSVKASAQVSGTAGANVAGR
jgi:hypothetical protein